MPTPAKSCEKHVELQPHPMKDSCFL